MSLTGCAFGGLPGWSYSQWSGYPGRAAHHRTAPAGICLRRPQSKRPGKEADIQGESRAGTFLPVQGPKVGVALTTTVCLDVSCLTSHTPAPSLQTSDITRLGSQTPKSVEAGKKTYCKVGWRGLTHLLVFKSTFSQGVFHLPTFASAWIQKCISLH